MTATTMRLGLVAFAVLGTAALVNITTLQPSGGRSAGARATAPGSPAPSVAAAEERRALAEREGVARAAVPRAAPEPSPAATSAATSAQDVIRAVQRELKDRGYETGAIDGQPGLMTRAAIMAYEHDRNLPLSAEPTSQLLKTILMNTAEVTSATRSVPPIEQSMQATHVIRTVQQSLVTLGYTPGKVDGRLGDDTVRAIRDFEHDQGMPETGRISGQLVARLARLAGQGRLQSGR